MAFPARKPLYCLFCSFKCDQGSILEAHMRRHTREKPFFCVECNRELSSKRSLVVHTQNLHRRQAKTYARKYNCALCTHTTYQKNALEGHIIQMHTGERSYPSKSSQALKKHNIGRHTTDRKYLCTFPNCGYRGKTKQGVREHFVSHSDIKPYSCDVPGCNYRSKKSGLLKKHQVGVHHGGHRPFACAMCNYTATAKYILRAHELTHSEEKPIKCDFRGCGYLCKSKANLRQHVVLHHKEKTFECDFAGCSVTAASRLVLKTHKKYVHFEKLYKCPSCDYRAAYLCKLREHQKRHNTRQWTPCPIEGCTFRSMNQNSLKRHVRYHDANLGCQFEGCGYVGRSSSNLKLHMRIHDSTGRPFPCPLCPKHFSTNNDLSKHLITHTEEKPFKCPSCHYASRNKYNVVRHVRTHHSAAFPEFSVDESSTCDHYRMDFGCTSGLAMHRLKLKMPVVVLTRLQLKLDPQ